LDIFKGHFLSHSTSAYKALGALAIMRYGNLRFTYLLTYVAAERLKLRLSMTVYHSRQPFVSKQVPTAAKYAV